MEVQSLRHEISKLKTEKAALTVKSKLFENFAAMAHTCCRLPSTSEWEAVKSTLQKTLEFSTELAGAQQGSLVLVDSNGAVTDSLQRPDVSDADQCCGSNGQVLDQGLAGWVKDHHQVGLITDTLNDDRWQPLAHQPQTMR